MNASELIQLYFQRANALQGYWTLYVIILGGLLAFSSLRERPSRITLILITILYSCFAYKNMGAIRDVTNEQRSIALQLRAIPYGSPVEATLRPQPDESILYFHLSTDALTVLALWAMERHRRSAQPALPPTP